MKISKEDILQSFKITIIASLLVLGAGYIYAWTGPSSNPPPADNVAAPINSGSVSQTKTGGLTIGGIFSSSGDMRLSEYSTQDMAYLQARDDSSDSSIGLQIRTQKDGDIVDVMKLGVDGSVEVNKGPIKARGGIIIETRTAAQGVPANPETGRMWLVN